MSLRFCHNPNQQRTSNMSINNAIDLIDSGSVFRATIHWFIYIMAAFSDVQNKVRKEIMEAIGSEKTPDYMDMRNMSYTNTVMLEMMRWKTILPLNLVH
ncbi:hypothetical protein AVEN_22966-1 [Araneus ventricosus]|uniref:Uncharacterized protein n=1 Tax=Araneus ventricosus TaxID=182803 RepID=A0A4Y2SUY4_ARAVE|nr:hypothetical protein AVEN_22966-1 [Araneus ventricosus]